MLLSDVFRTDRDVRAPPKTSCSPGAEQPATPAYNFDVSHAGFWVPYAARRGLEWFRHRQPMRDGESQCKQELTLNVERTLLLRISSRVNLAPSVSLDASLLGKFSTIGHRLQCTVGQNQEPEQRTAHNA